MTHTERIRETLATVSRAPREELCEIVGELEKARLVVYSRMAQPEREPEDQFIGVEEAGRMLGLGASTLYRRANTLPFAIRVAGRLRFSRTGIKRWADARGAA